MRVRKTASTGAAGSLALAAAIALRAGAGWGESLEAAKSFSGTLFLESGGEPGAGKSPVGAGGEDPRRAMQAALGEAGGLKKAKEAEGRERGGEPVDRDRGGPPPPAPAQSKWDRAGRRAQECYDRNAPDSALLGVGLGLGAGIALGAIAGLSGGAIVAAAGAAGFGVAGVTIGAPTGLGATKLGCAAFHYGEAAFSKE